MTDAQLTQVATALTNLVASQVTTTQQITDLCAAQARGPRSGHGNILATLLNLIPQFSGEEKGISNYPQFLQGIEKVELAGPHEIEDLVNAAILRSTGVARNYILEYNCTFKLADGTVVKHPTQHFYDYLNEQFYDRRACSQSEADFHSIFQKKDESVDKYFENIRRAAEALGRGSPSTL